MKKNLVVIQEGNKDCGAASLLSIIRYYGGDISLDRLVEMTNTTKEGTNFYNMSEAVSKFRLIAKCYKVDDVDKIRNLSVPFIVQLNNKNYTHFVVVYKIYGDKIMLMDPSSGKSVMNIFDFFHVWTGYIMLFEKMGEIPNYKESRVLNKIIEEVLIKNVNIILFIVILSIIFTLLSSLIGLYSQFVFDNVMDTNINNLIIVTLFFSVLLVVKNITNYVRNHLVIYLNQKLDVSIILSTYSKVILLPYSYYKNKTTSEVLSRINDLSYLKNFISKMIVTVFLDFLTFIISLIIIYFINFKVLFILLFTSVMYICVVILFNGIMKKNAGINLENNASVNNMIVESIGGYETVKNLNIQDNMIFKFSKLYSGLLNNLYYSEKVNNCILFIKEMITDICVLFVNFITIKYIMDGILTIGNYMTITFLSNFVIYPIRNIIEMIREYHYAMLTLKRGNSLLEYDEENIFEKEKLSVNGDIKFNKLKYSFNNKYYILKNISFFIRNRERVLILGETGSGKSTIMRILYKYYEVDRGCVYINGFDINDYGLTDIRNQITYISQNEMLFTGSIRDNILLDREVGEIEFLNICNIVHVNDIVKNNMLGYEYMIEEGGVNLSGGQRQRIVLARSLLKNSNVIIIDEGLNQIDTLLEREILTNIFNYFYDKTFIIISHRKENIDLFDKIVKISNGSVKEIIEDRKYDKIHR